MILRPAPSLLRTQSPLLPAFPRRNPCFPRRRRRRRRPPEPMRPRSVLEDFFGSLVAAFPSPVSIDLLLAPALGFTSGAALYLASTRGNTSGGDDAAGDWILFTSPTPFNRYVLLRCPSVSFEDGGELLEGLNDRLVTEDRHYVNLSRGSIPASKSGGERGHEEDVLYQRFCVGTDDGGVVSLDWPENLDLGREHGLDTVVLIVPGTTDGSMDRNVKDFVYGALKHGYFPVVMNPRGCAGSPLTTPRLFTAADSDDVSTAIQFINKLRPWSTFMSIGWGFGANMLTKYLAEAGESTPITAAVCIDNPFDLAEATRSFPHHIALDRKLTSGLMDILHANKELFQGKTKGFDVGKALSATTVRDFDKAISMISFGCDDIEDFYSKISTMKMIGSLKIPVLFIQSDDGTVPLFSVPRSSIAENPFTSLLLCSCLPSSVTGRDSYTISWCQHLALEWFSAVELALLKGRHPILKDLDVTINPTTGLSIVDDRRPKNKFIEGINEPRSHDSARLFLRRKNQSLMKLGQSNPVNGFLVDPDVAIQDKFSSSFDSGNTAQALGRASDEGRRHDGAGEMENANVDEEADSEKSQVLASASFIMNMLDITLPGVLDDEQKKKVLTAVGRGETFMKALQGAVPDDVRGKLTNAVAEIVQTQKANLNVKGLGKIGWSKDTMKETSKTQIPGDDASVNSDGSIGNLSNHNVPEVAVPSDQTTDQVPGPSETEVDVGNKSTQSSNLERTSSDVDQAGLAQKVNQPPGVTESATSDDKVATNNAGPTPPDGDLKSNSEELNNSISSTRSVETNSATSLNSDGNETGKEGSEIQKKDNRVTQEMDQTLDSSPRPEESSSPHSSSRPPSISVTQALDALTGFDDSTQMAVNSVFGVLENMIDQLEKNSNEANGNTPSEGEEKQSNILTRDFSSAEEIKSQRIAYASDESSANINFNEAFEQPVDYATKDQFHSRELVKGKMIQNKVPDSLTMTGEQSNRQSHGCPNQTNPFKSSNSIGVGSEQNFALDIARNPYYWGSPYHAYLQRHLFTRVPALNSSNLDMATELFLDPEEGQWKMLDVGASDNVYEDDQSQINSNQNFSQSAPQRGMEIIIEPSYVILETDDTWSDRQPIDTNDSWDSKNDEMIHLVKKSLLDSLKIEVGRKLGFSKLSEIEDYVLADIEHVADSVIRLILLNNQLSSESHADCDGSAPGKFGTIKGHHITEIISLALLDASHLKKILPDGLIVGSVLACLRKYFDLSTTSNDGEIKTIEKSGNCNKKIIPDLTDDSNEIQGNLEAHQDDANSVNRIEECSASKFSNEDLVAGAVTAALGASAILAGHQQNLMGKDDTPLEAGSVNKSWKDAHEEQAKHEEAMQEKNHLGIVSSLAEKAISVAGPVVPKKGDGEVDQERLVAVLAELGQKGGILRLVGKVALLWGGIRGAMSLTDRLISFLRIAERSLPQRILGFGCMVLVLWSPVVIPLLPAVVQSWTMATSNRIAEDVCRIGLYASVMILVMLWGKRIRGYDNPLDQYGLDLTVPRVQDFLKGLVGGISIVTVVHSINVLLGISLLSWSSSLPSLSAGPIFVLKAYGNITLLAIRGIVAAVGIALVEELLFRSWLPAEVAVEFGFYRAIMVSGLIFSLIHRSLRSMPGFLMLSLALSGIKQRTMNRIYAPIGVRAGIIIMSFTLQAGGFIKFKADTPFWLINSCPMHPFDSAVGLSIAALLSIIFFPRHQQRFSTNSEE